MYAGPSAGAGATGVLAITGLGPVNGSLVIVAVSLMVGGLLLWRSARRRRTR